MSLCSCGQVETVIAVGYRKDRLDVRPVKIHADDAAQLGKATLFILKQQTKDYVKKEDGSKYGFNIARYIANLSPGHQGMTSDEDIVVYVNGNTLDLRKCNLRVQLVSETRPARQVKPGEYGSAEHISTFETPKRRNSADELWNRQVTA